ncbi:type II toxin-antitoxin system HicA family toxin [Dyadobacter endophyticus]|uniref:type II toxin-antitoxin system HicA family toxin n=1 Tax=Dyadobacter endophyticus TaxID=1749036 RepID=UPI00166D3F0B|nr:type II toxin-antitoxin system HicA family toxin [Dyadobacter endophyticus]
MSVKRNEFMKHLEKHGCFLRRHGAKHDLYVNHDQSLRSTVPRHPRLDKSLCETICKQLGIEKF